MRLKRLALSMLLSGGFALAARAEPELPADCSAALSTVDMNNCAGAEFEKADAELNRV